MLTDKAKTMFEKWYKENINEVMECNFDIFKILPFSMQQGVYLKFFDSVGIEIESGKTLRQWQCKIFYFGDIKETQWHNTRQEALKEAIKKANEILNK